MSIGNRIRYLRKKKHLTQETLAQLVGCSKITIIRYEQDEFSPGAEILENLAKVLDVSSSYLLGISDEFGIYGKQQRHILELLRVLKNKPIDGESYFWIDMTPGGLEWNAQTIWIGTSADGQYDLRTLRPFRSAKTVRYCAEAYGQPLIINDLDDAMVFLDFGGQSFVRESVVREYMPTMLEPIKVERPTYDYDFSTAETII